MTDSAGTEGSEIHPERHVVVLADSLSNDFMNARHSGVPVNIGGTESERLIGNSANGFHGPLTVFLREAIAAQCRGQRVGIIEIEDLHDANDPMQAPELIRYGNHNMVGTAGANTMDPLQDILRTGRHRRVDVTSLSVPIVSLREAVQEATGIDLLSATPEQLRLIIFILAGAHTNIRVMDTAISLRQKFGCPNVIVCPHLTGSADIEAHKEAVKRWIPAQLVRVAQSVREVCEASRFAIPAPELITWSDSCEILPASVMDALGQEQRSIIETIFMEDDMVNLQPLGGGFSGSWLFMATGWKRRARLSPVIVKIDKSLQIKREVDGYNRVKDYLGNNVPGYEAPVSVGLYTGMRINIATMKGSPKTLQDGFEAIRDIDELGDYEAVFAEILECLNSRLYVNTKRTETVDLTHAFELDEPMQATWLNENLEALLPGCSSYDQLALADGVVIDNPAAKLTKLMDRPAIIEQTETCIVHRDLNYANTILDERNNYWFIDWTHTGYAPVEMDFAKMENDLKFAISKEFTDDDLPNLEIFEYFVLGNLALPGEADLPEALSFVKNDFRFRKIYRALKMLRAKYSEVKGENPNAEMTYKGALLRYALHTLHFDKKRGNGELDPPAIKYALLSNARLIDDLLKLTDASK